MRNPFDHLPMFSGLNDAQQKALAQCAEMQRFTPDQILFHEGDQADGFFILVKGRVKMRKTSQSGHEIVLHLASPPNMIGCRALTREGSRYPADAVAMDPVEALRFTRALFLKAVSNVPDVFFGLLIDMNQRLSEIYTLQAALMEPVERRIASLIMQQSLPENTEFQEWRKHPLKEVRLTKSMIASIVGTTTETAIRVLSKWKKAGWVASSRGSLRVLHAQPIVDLLAAPLSSAPSSPMMV